ncbi:MAG: DUF2232 domain-containing protein [Hyphomicrobiaceae bacterium]
MTTNQILLAIAAGLIAAVVFASATTGPMFVRLVLYFLTPLSLYLVGLGIAPAAASIAAIVATLAILVMTNPLAALVFAASAAAPATLTTRLALLGRQENGEVVEWYPLGRILFAAALFAGLFAAIAITMLGTDLAAVTKAMKALVESFVKTELASLPGNKPMTDPEISAVATRVLTLMPITLAALSLITTLLNLWLAGRITRASGRLVRPWPDISTIAMPPVATIFLLAALLLAFVNGVIGLAAGGFAGALFLAFAVVGLVIAHHMTRSSPWRGFILATLYAGLLFLTPAVVLVLAIAGLADTIFSFRNGRHNTPSGPQRPPTP